MESSISSKSGKTEKKCYVDLTDKKSKEPVEKSNRAGIAVKCSCLPALYNIGDNPK